jgi:hypothetical protein
MDAPDRPCQSVGPSFPFSLLGLLKKTRDAHFYEFVKVARGDPEEPYSFKKRIVRVERFFEDAVVELHPGKVAVEEQTRVIRLKVAHGMPLRSPEAT